MVPVKIQTLIVSGAPSPSVIVLLPLEDAAQITGTKDASGGAFTLGDAPHVAPRSAPPIVDAATASEPQKNCRIVPIWIGVNEATQMGMALEGARFTRPMTHDLFLDALTNLDAQIDHVLINDMRKSTFYAKLVLRQHNRLIEIDSRPSDALALAVRQQAPIYIDEQVLERASYPYVFRQRPDEETELEAFHQFVADLSPDDFID